LSTFVFGLKKLYEFCFASGIVGFFKQSQGAAAAPLLLSTKVYRSGEKVQAKGVFNAITSSRGIAANQFIIIYLYGACLSDGPLGWRNFSLMRKYPVELQSYGVLNFSVMGYEDL
jgi:hypothetical protein